MKKLPTLFVKSYEGNKFIRTTHIVRPGFQWVLKGQGMALEKIDGACCAIIDGKFYKRFDAKPGRKVPEGAIPCCDPDPVTGHHPHWVLVNENDPADKWFMAAYNFTKESVGKLEDGTYEAIGKHFQGNPYEFEMDMLAAHSKQQVHYPIRTFSGIRDYLREHDIEGLVFWKDGEPQCKIKRTDFGFPWR